eukprot:TRINITY_DN10953_c0_g4_i2.p1 TRINITY_DN10953_c0_g4~~TRINITY_DN10953_c0_g4_i2.p1  ORF type:complete len:144 (+),score=19.96 TRINITY_DN10953_c0_g4_i2:38-433(+)
MEGEKRDRVQQIAYLVQKVKLGGDSEWERDEILDVIHWSRQLLALLCGVICGVVGITDIPGFIIFAVVTFGTTVIFYRSYLRVDEEELGGSGELAMEGMMSAFAIFLLVWISLYTLQNYEDIPDAQTTISQ